MTDPAGSGLTAVGRLVGRAAAVSLCDVCFLGIWRVTSAQVERPVRPGSSQIRGFGLRAPGAPPQPPPAKTWIVDLRAWGRVLRPTTQLASGVGVPSTWRAHEAGIGSGGCADV